MCGCVIFQIEVVVGYVVGQLVGQIVVVVGQFQVYCVGLWYGWIECQVDEVDFCFEVGVLVCDVFVMVCYLVLVGLVGIFVVMQ